MKVTNMECGRFRGVIIELARQSPEGISAQPGVNAHLSGCAACRSFLEEQIALTFAISRMATADLQVLPPDLESTLEGQFVAQHSRQRLRRVGRAAAGALLAIAAALLLVAIIHRPEPLRNNAVSQQMSAVRRAVEAPPRPPAKLPEVAGVRRKPARRRPPEADPGPAQADRGDQPFVAIPFTLPLDPREQATVVRMALPVAALAAVGFPLSDPDPRASANADVVIGEDGRIRAVRLLSISDPAFNAR